jgi:gamma-glutamylcyclotransferase (GGCT)/AIG2-like uncharacterized protein YtfP
LKGNVKGAANRPLQHKAQQWKELINMKIYAAYGSNMNLAQMKMRCPKAKVIGNGELAGYKLTFRGRNNGVANVERDPAGCVPIVLWTITGECERALDRYEGYPTLYKKEIVRVTTATGEQEAMLYVMAKQYESMPALPIGHYFEIIRQGYEDNGIDVLPLQEALLKTKLNK